VVTVVTASDADTGLAPNGCDAIYMTDVYHYFTEPRTPWSAAHGSCPKSLARAPKRIRSAERGSQSTEGYRLFRLGENLRKKSFNRATRLNKGRTPGDCIKVALSRIETAV
jgi:hypothetical protein